MTFVMQNCVPVKSDMFFMTIYIARLAGRFIGRMNGRNSPKGGAIGGTCHCEIFFCLLSVPQKICGRLVACCKF